MTTIFFDMDGTIADLYGVNNWLEMLLNAKTAPYENAKPLVRLCSLAKVLNRLQREGYRLGVISWLAKNGSLEYGERVETAKREWLKKHLPSVTWDEINIVPYGFEKFHFALSKNDLLFDDEAYNRVKWTGKAYDATKIMDVLKSL